MIWLWIVIGVVIVFLLFTFWGACKVGADMDRRMEAEFQRMMESRSQHDVDGSLHEEATENAS